MSDHDPRRETPRPPPPDPQREPSPAGRPASSNDAVGAPPSLAEAQPATSRPAESAAGKQEAREAAPIEQPPADLRRAVHGDMHPVRPLRSPLRRALVLLPLVLLVVAVQPIVYGLRGDADVVGVFDMWGLSAAQALLGFLLIAVALREAVPGRSVPRVRALLAIGVIASIVVTFVTFSRSATYAPPRFVGLFWTICFSRPLMIGLPLVGVGLVAAWRAYPLRAALVGALVGLGAGLVTDAGWRTFCHVSDPWHVLSAHLAAVLALCGTGAAAAAVLSHHRR